MLLVPKSIKKFVSLSKLLGINQFQVRISHDDCSFLQCSCWAYFIVSVTKDNFPYKSKYFFEIEENGFLNSHNLELFANYQNMSCNIGQIRHPKDFCAKLLEMENVDCSELVAILKRRKNSLLLRKQFLELTAYKMLFSRNSLPVLVIHVLEVLLECLIKHMIWT